MSSLIVLDNGEELRPEEAIVLLLNQVKSQQKEIDRLKERVQWFERQGL